MKTKLLLLLFLANFTIYAQEYTQIPDPNFEQALIDQGYDDIIDGKVPTANISSITSLDVSGWQIKDLTGIEAFTSLVELVAIQNKLTTLDLSSNTLLKSLTVYYNELTTLDLSSNTLLEFLDLGDNQLSSINVSKNTALRELYVTNNKLKILDVSGSPDLYILRAPNNRLTGLNLKNVKISGINNFNFTNNPNLTCIQVDDLAAANASDRILKDATAEFNLDCTEYTLIPDPNFEQALIDLEYDDTIDGKVATENISTITELFVPENNIEDLTGIEDFSELTTLIVSENKLKTLDITKNKKLGALLCDNNQLTHFTFSEENTALYGFDCSNNELTSIDVSKNPAIYVVICNDNKLKYLNLQNRSEDLLYTTVSKFTGNANLKCILVDDVEFANTNWETLKDETATYNTNCGTLGTPSIIVDKSIVYPNPTKGDLHIDNITLEKATVYDALGKLIKTTTFSGGSNSNTINLGGSQSGIYYIYLQSGESTIVKKIIVE